MLRRVIADFGGESPRHSWCGWCDSGFKELTCFCAGGQVSLGVLMTVVGRAAIDEAAPVFGLCAKRSETSFRRMTDGTYLSVLIKPTVHAPAATR